MSMNYSTIFADARSAARSIALLSDKCRQEVLLAVADAIDQQQESLLAANTKDLALMDSQNPLYDRLQLSVERLRGIADDMRNVAALQSPLGHISKQR
ncbi:MAG: gamma-glutamyl-phosphate reductase, partial [Prevotella sp.]|nr:gamma-glutamyl-phosphate reductase [Prevotella sp.]